MLSVSLDPSRRVPIYFRKNRDGIITFNFFNVDGSDKDISAIDFELKIFAKEGSTIVVYQPEQVVESPITNSISYTFTANGSNIRAKKYYWQLNIPAQDVTWLNGPAFCHDGEYDDQANNEVSVTVNDGGNAVNITIQVDAGDPGVWTSQGNWDGSTDLFPTTPDPVLKGYLYFNTANSVNLLMPDGGIIPAGAIIVAKVNNPGQVVGNWYFLLSVT